ncbi:MAG: filamentous hemagglutinin N-terminal domain-containing protein, partial [Chlamydiia bacterium]|nr:filamentous hemagglutinin N-terminal domain-containing protein [Chlamydiia bacterium]
MNLSRIKDAFLFHFFCPLFPFIFFASSLLALPKTHQVKVGTATLSENGKHLHIVTGDKTIIHWKDFSINPGEIVRFIQPGKESAVLNRVTGGSPSKIFGTLKANGSLYLINKHGVIIGKEGLVEVGNFLASTLDVRNSDFLNGKELLFNGKTQQEITNLGTIHAWDGTVTLLGFTVVNSGHIEADRVQMGAGHSILLKPDGEGIYIKTSSGEKGEVGISHTGTIHALETQLKADGNLYALAIKDDGIIDAGSFINRSGRVYLVGDGGTTEVGGFINAPKG